MGASGTDPFSRGTGAASDATLRTVEASDSPGVVAIGAKDDAAAGTDTGTFSLIALVKRLLAKITAFTANAGAAVAVVGRSSVITVAQVVTATAYEAADAIGGKITLANAVLEAGGASLLHQIVILDRSNTKPSGSILIFNADPAAATITDELAFVLSTDDLKVIARIPVAASDYATIDSKAIADLSNLGRLCKAAAGTTLYAAFVADGTSLPTFAATTDLQLTFKFLPN